MSYIGPNNTSLSGSLSRLYYPGYTLKKNSDYYTVDEVPHLGFNYTDSARVSQGTYPKQFTTSEKEPQIQRHIRVSEREHPATVNQDQDHRSFVHKSTHESGYQSYKNAY